MTKLFLALVAVMFVSVASFAQEGGAPAGGTPGVENAPAPAPAKKEMKHKGKHEKHHGKHKGAEKSEGM